MLTKDEIKKLTNLGNVINIYHKRSDYIFTFYYIYQGDSQEAVFLNNKFYGYFDLDEYVDQIKTRKDEKKYLTKLIKEEIEDYNLEYCSYDYALVILGKLQELKRK